MPAQEEELRNRIVSLEQRWHGLLDTTDDGIAVLDGAGKVVEHNRLFGTLVGLGEVAIAGEHLADLVAARAPTLAAYARVPDGALQLRATIAGRALEISARPLELPSRERAGTFVVVRDITEHLLVQARDKLIETELARAQAFQATLLAAPPPIPDYDIELVYRPLDRVGGDMYDITLMPARSLRIFIADATGHGISAALVTMFVKSAYESVKYTLGGPAAVLEALNDRVATTYRNFEAIFTAIVIDFAIDTRLYQYANAGHPPPLVVDATGVHELEFGGTVIGAQAYRTYPSWSGTIAQDASLYLVTDGITEARRPDGEQFGDERLFEALAQVDPATGDATTEILARVEAWLGSARVNDDITLLGLRPKRRQT